MRKVDKQATFCCPFYLYELFRCLSCDPVSDFSSDRVIKILCYLELRSLRSGNAYDFYTCQDLKFWSYLGDPGKGKLVRIIGRFEKSGVILQCLIGEGMLR